MKTKVAIVILNWNGSEMLRTFLPSVLRYSNAECVRVFVADNASTDDSVFILKNEFPEVELIVLDRNYGFADGYNRALEQIESNYYVLLNSDVEVTNTWLQPMIDYMDDHPEVAACQPKIMSWKDRNCFEYAGASGGFIDRYGYPFCRGRVLGTLEKDERQYDDIIPVFWVTGAALFIRAKAYWDVGGLDGRFFAHMEEIDLCWRLRSRGYLLVCIPQSVVYHVGGGTLKKESPQKTFLNFRNNLVMLYKNIGDDELGPIMRIRFVLDYIAAFTFLLKGQFSNAWAVVRARRAFKQIKNDFSCDRDENLKKRIQKNIPERIKSSILVLYYIRGKKYFTQINKVWKN